MFTTPAKPVSKFNLYRFPRCIAPALLANVLQRPTKTLRRVILAFTGAVQQTGSDENGNQPADADGSSRYRVVSSSGQSYFFWGGGWGPIALQCSSSTLTLQHRFLLSLKRHSLQCHCASWPCGSTAYAASCAGLEGRVCSAVVFTHLEAAAPRRQAVVDLHFDTAGFCML